MLAGGTLVLAEPHTRADMSRLAQYVRAAEATSVFVPSIYLDEFALALSGVRIGESQPPLVVAVGGGPLHALPDVLSGVRYWNMYGPAEANVVSTAVEVSASPGKDPRSIGVAVAGASVVLVDDAGEEVGAGALGEICIGGPRVASGYVSASDSERQSFVERSGERWYRTGDLGRRAESGELLFIGRRDRQVKVAGLRVELEGIEAAARRFDGVAAAAVVVSGRDAACEVGLLLAPREGSQVAVEAVREYLQGILPSASQPNVVRVVAELPLTPRAKVDYPEVERIVFASRSATATGEQALREVWSDLLGCPGATTGFVSSGGNSLAALRCRAAVRRAGWDLSLAALLSDEPYTSVEATLTAQDAAAPASRSALATPQQLSAYIEEQLAPGNAYQFEIRYTFSPVFEPERFVNSVAVVLAQHSVFAQGYHYDGSALRVVQWEGARFDVNFHMAETLESADSWLDDAATEPWDRERGPLIRLRLVSLPGGYWRVSQAEHHFVHDGLSFSMLAGQAFRHYRTGLVPAGSDYASATMSYERHDSSADLAYWEKYLHDVPRPPAGPTPLSAAGKGPQAARSLSYPLPRSVLDAAQARFRSSTSFDVLAWAFAKALTAASGEPDVVLGTAVSGRSSESESVVGMFVNTACLRLDTTASDEEGLASLRVSVAHAVMRGITPYRDVLERLRERQGRDVVPFHALFSLHQGAFPREDFAAAGGVAASFESNGWVKAPIDVTVISDEASTDEDWEVRWEYARDMFDDAQIDSLWRAFQRALHDLGGSSVGPFGLASMIEGPALEVETIEEITARLVARQDTDPAVSSEGKVVSWRELGRIMRRDEPTPCALSFRERSAEHVVEVMRRLHQRRPTAPYSSESPRPTSSALSEDRDVAYVVRTSGSSGTSKVVLVDRTNLANHVAGYVQASGLRSGDVFLTLSSFAFDAFWEETLSPLAVGARLVVGDAHQGMAALIDLARREAVTVIGMTTALFHLLVDHLEECGEAPPPSLRLIIIGGEAYRPSRLEVISRLAPRVAVMNSYGPAEATISPVCCYLVHSGRTVFPVHRNVIGRPLPNVTAYVVGDHGVVERGEIGELWLSGAGVARGYGGIHDGAPSPFMDNPFGSGRVYRTGDLVRMSPDGNLDYLGRQDRQVKVRGFRVDLSEIEDVLLRHPDVRDCAAVLTERAYDREVEAYVKTSLDVTALARWVRHRLPPASVPRLVRVERLPLTESGKIDQRMLPRQQPDVPGAPPGSSNLRAGLESALAATWREVLEVDAVGPHDNFLELGGHSLTALRLQATVAGRMGLHIPLSAILSSSSLRRLVEDLQTQAGPDDHVRRTSLPRTSEAL